MTPARSRLSTAGRLLARLAARDGATLDHLARHLGLPRTDLEASAEGRLALPPRTQLALADAILGEAVLAAPTSEQRLARALRGQALAAIAFEQKDTETHMTSPSRWVR